MAKAISFYNWTDEDFTYTWDKVEYEFPAKTSMYLEAGLAQHFAKHLTDREMLKCKDDKGVELPTNHFSRNEFIAKCFPDIKAVEAKNATELQVKMDNMTPEVVEKPVKKKKEEEKPAFEE